MSETRTPVFADTLAAAQAGQPWATREIWTRFSPSVAGYLRARGSREAEDLTSEVFLTVFDQLSRFTGDDADFRAFVFTITHRRLVDELRRRSRRGASVEWSDDADPRVGGSAEDDALARLGDA